MLVLEAFRQLSIATSHLSGLPSGTAITPVNYDTHFFGFATKHIPLTMRGIVLFSEGQTGQEKEGFCICNLFQWGKLVADASIGAFGFIQRPAYERQRERSSRVAERSRRQYRHTLQGLTGAGEEVRK